MNKSKFLRKSLALLLSVLMVVAMIPVGASAADTNTVLNAIYVNGESVTVSNKTFAADVTSKDVKVWVTELKNDETATLTKSDETTVTVSGSSAPAATNVNLDDFNANGNVYTLPLTLTNGDATATYTIQLTLVPLKTTVELASVTGTIVSGSTTYSLFNTSISGKTINVTAPLGYRNEGTLVVKTKDSATIKTVSKATLTGTASPYTLTNVEDGATITVQSQSEGNTAVYTVKVTEVAGLNTLTIGGVEGTVTDKDEDGTADTITFTFPASVLETDVTTGAKPASSFEVKHTTRSDTTVELDTTGYYNKVESGDEVDFIDSNALMSGKKVKVTCKSVAHEYDLVLETEKSSDCTVASATIDDETATITGNKITANLAEGTTGNVTVALTAPAGATFSGATFSTADATADDDGNKKFTASLDVDALKKGVIITVKAEDGEASKQYEIKVTVTGTVDTAYLTAFQLRIGGDKYDGVINGNKITVTVPYMTTDAQLKAAKVVTGTNAYVGAYKDDQKGVISTAEDLGLKEFDLTANQKSGTETGTIYAVAKKATGVKAEYSITVKLEDAQPGNTLSNLIVSSAANYKKLDSSNTFPASVKTDAKKKTGTITIEPSYSAGKAGKDLYVKSYATVNDGVAYVRTTSGSTNSYKKLDEFVYDDYEITVTPNNSNGGFAKATENDSAATIVVMNEVEARAQDNKGTEPTNAVVYTVKAAPKAASTVATLSSVVFDKTTLNSTLSGSVPYSVTAKDDNDTDNAMFVDFTISDNATLVATDGTTEWPLVKNGDIDENGKADTIGDKNAKLMLVRNTSTGKVTMKMYDGNDVKTVTKLVVTAEDGATKSSQSVGNITYAAPNTEAKITAFSVAKTAGSIKAEGDSNWTITVNAPLGTDLTSLIPTFTASAGAKVEWRTSKVVSDETTIDFSSDVVLTVTSEDEAKTNTYTVKVTASTSFSDVKTTDWFYDNVMAAYKAGYCSGNPDGTFAPNENITRRDVAIMVYKMMGSPAVTSTASFVDVTEGDYAANAIAYLKEADIVSGDAETGKFRPGDKITRQEVASILAKAKKLSGTTDNLFKDDAKISDWAKPAVYACRAAGVFNGDDNGNFNAQDYIIRAEVATAVLQAASK